MSQKNLFILDHPLKGQYLKALRDKNSSSEVFRNQATRLGALLAIEMSRDLTTNPQNVETPLKITQENIINQNIALVPILRAGIGMVDPFLQFIPSAQVHFLGMYRDHDTHMPVSYYNKLPDGQAADVAYILDPMLATGGSAIATIDAMKKWGVKKIKFAGLIGAPEGVKIAHEAHPDVEIYLASLDENLDKNAYIIPGLGDAGDRVFNT